MLKSVTCRFLALLACLVLCASMAAAGDISATLKPDVSSIKPGEEITLNGEVRHPGTDLDGTLLQLRIETDPKTEGIEEPLITAINGEEMDSEWWDSEMGLLEEETLGDLLRVSGKWTVPEDASFNKAKITLSVLCADGSVYTASCELENAQPTIFVHGLTVLQLASILLVILSAVCGIWLLLHRRKKTD